MNKCAKQIIRILERQVNRIKEHRKITFHIPQRPFRWLER